MRTVYEVNLETDPEIAIEFEEWLHEHVQHMLMLPGFLAAAVAREERPADLPAAFSVRYTLTSRPALDAYFVEHANRMRDQGIERFGARFRATRRILTVLAGASLPLAHYIRPIRAAQTRLLRQAVLRPHQQAELLIYDDDDAPATVHLGAYRNHRLLGIASLYHQAPNDQEAAGMWRLRGMAVHPDAQGSGLGRALAEAGLQHVAGRGATLLWCNARSNAAGFYRKLGFVATGEEFELAGIGPHWRMHRTIVVT